MMDDNTPALGGEKRQNAGDCAPMLGGDRAVMVPCKECGGDTIRDWFGNWVCMECLSIKQQFKSIAEHEKCSYCGVGHLIDLPHNILFSEFDEIEFSLDRNCYGALYCEKCHALHDVYRENGKIRVWWLEK